MAKDKTLDDNQLAQKMWYNLGKSSENDLGYKRIFHFKKKNHFIFHSESNFLFLKLHV